jgi:predicted nuclease of predicted toxin-antitoxin system
LATASDLEIWDCAEKGGYVLATHDVDFAEMAALRGPPPKVIWLRCGNQPTREIERVLRGALEAIQAFDQDADAACLELY